MKLTLTIFCFLSVTIAFAQNNIDKNTATLQPDQRLYEVYEASYIDRLMTDNPFLIKRWNYYLDNAYYLVDAVPEKTKDNPTITISDLDNINILLLEKEQGLTHDHRSPVIYNIRNTTKCLVYLPGEEFAQKFRATLEK